MSQQYCSDLDQGIGHKCSDFDGGVCHGTGPCGKRVSYNDYRWMVHQDFSEVEAQIRKDLKPYIEAMVAEQIRHYPQKRDTWKILMPDTLNTLLTEAMKTWENEKPDNQHQLVDIGILAAFQYLRYRYYKGEKTQ